MQIDLAELSRPPEEIAERCRRRLEEAVGIDSQSDERSERIPSSAGQEALAALVERRLSDAGAAVDRDRFGCVIASLPGRHAGRGAAPLALMVHLDTARGTAALSGLRVHESWSGDPIPYPARPDLRVGLETFPQTRAFLGHDLLLGPGDAPFGLDDKLGLAQMLTLAELLAEQEHASSPPLVLVARPDEEIGRMEAVRELAVTLAERGVRHGFTLDGILPFEINVENFNASSASLTFPSRPLATLPGPSAVRVAEVGIGGVNTHGATAKAEGYRAATRLAAEIVAQLEESGALPRSIVPISFASDALRDCDGRAAFVVGGEDGEEACRAWGLLERALAETVGPHVPRGASWSVSEPLPLDPGAHARDGSTLEMLRFVARLLGDEPGFVVAAEESSGREGYSAPYRALPAKGGVTLDVRLRDFEEQGLRRREEHVRGLARSCEGVELRVAQQYVNMGPHLGAHPLLVDWPRRAAALAGVEARVEPIRGGTGVDPFLEHGVAVANLGTGYFAPESEKEFTSLQMMARHVAWLFALVQVAAAVRD
ncbi:MAG: hypothetical protein OEQ13_06580 [Acidobacteriota bacterium]|nr:hypothetical protein [Acidobacteriota bacterium]